MDSNYFTRIRDSQEASRVNQCNLISLKSASLFTVHALHCVTAIKLLLMQTENFLLLLFHFKNIQPVKHRVAFTVKQYQQNKVLIVCQNFFDGGSV